MGNFCKDFERIHYSLQLAHHVSDENMSPKRLEYNLVASPGIHVCCSCKKNKFHKLKIMFYKKDLF